MQTSINNLVQIVHRKFIIYSNPAKSALWHMLQTEFSKNITKLQPLYLYYLVPKVYEK